MHLQNAVRQLYHLNKVCLPALRNGFKNKKKTLGEHKENQCSLMLAEEKFMLKANVVHMPVMCRDKLVNKTAHTSKPGLHNPYLRLWSRSKCFSGTWINMCDWSSSFTWMCSSEMSKEWPLINISRCSKSI